MPEGHENDLCRRKEFMYTVLDVLAGKYVSDACIIQGVRRAFWSKVSSPCEESIIHHSE